uniref:Secreted protein n=1 Tax=Anopheles melas TaxID=34690 RepID=A0A182UCI4_9DIPT
MLLLLLLLLLPPLLLRPAAAPKHQLQRVATATLHISTNRYPWRSPAAHAWPEISTCVTTPSGCTWNPSWPIGLRRKLSSSAPHPFVTARSRSITSSCSSRSPVSRMFSVTHSP